MILFFIFKHSNIYKIQFFHYFKNILLIINYLLLIYNLYKKIDSILSRITNLLKQENKKDKR